MQVIWPASEVTTDDVQTALRRQERSLSDGSVRKMLSILVDKGYLTRRRLGRGFVYKPTVPERQAIRTIVSDLLKRVFDGSAAQMVAALLDCRAVSREDLERIKGLIDQQELEKEQ